MSFKGKYTMQSHGWPGPAYVLCRAHRAADRSQHVSVKLFARGVDYLQEKALLETPTITLQEYLPGIPLSSMYCHNHQNAFSRCAMGTFAVCVRICSIIVMPELPVKVECYSLHV